jgi:hypothetical protein
MISSNSSAIVSRPLAVTGYSNVCPSGTGAPPILPAAAWRFSDCIAEITSSGVICWLAIRSGSSQTRIAYLRPKTLMSLTPWIRLSTSTRLICA